MKFLGWTVEQWGEVMAWFEDRGGVIPRIDLVNPIELMQILSKAWRLHWHIEPGERQIVLLDRPWKKKFGRHPLVFELIHDAVMKSQRWMI